MKVDDAFSPSSDLRSQSVGRTAEPAPATRPQGRKVEPGNDAANLSALSVELARAIDQEPPEVLAKIARLQEAVANGTYSVPSAQVSARIVGAALGSE